MEPKEMVIYQISHAHSSSLVRIEQYKKAEMSLACIKSLNGFSSQVTGRCVFNVLNVMSAFEVAPRSLSFSESEIIYEYIDGGKPKSLHQVLFCINSLRMIHSIDLKKLGCNEFQYFRDIVRNFVLKLPMSLIYELGLNRSFDKIFYNLEYGLLCDYSHLLHMDPNLSNWLIVNNHARAIDWNTVCIGSEVVDIALLIWDIGLQLSPQLASQVYSLCIQHYQYNKCKLKAALRMVANLQYISHVAAHRCIETFTEYQKKYDTPISKVRLLFNYIDSITIDKGE